MEEMASRCVYGFLHPLHGFEGAPDRWSERRQRGLTDTELRQAIAYELGIHGGSLHNEWNMRFGGISLGMAGIYGVTRTPYIAVLEWPNKRIDEEAVILQGDNLVRYVRTLLQIPYPNKNFPLFKEISE